MTTADLARLRYLKLTQIPVYENACFRTYMVREESPGDLRARMIFRSDDEKLSRDVLLGRLGQCHPRRIDLLQRGQGR